MIRLLPLAAMALLTVSGCKAGPDYVRPAPPPSAALDSGQFVRAGEAVADAPTSRWWEVLENAELSGLIEAGLAEAPTIEAAVARMKQARAGIGAARASLLPAVSASATYVYADLPADAFAGATGHELIALGFDTSWEADLWGGRRRDVERALAEAGAAEARLADAQVSLTAEIARTYATLQARRISGRLLSDRKSRETELVALARQRFQGGTGTAQDVALARQRLDRSEAELAALEAETAALLDGLAVLTGRTPGSLELPAEPAIPLPPASVAVGDPAAMLARRPDVMEAERRLAAASARIGIAEARRFPSVSLLGLIGIGGAGVDELFDGSRPSIIAAPRLSWNFLDFGRNAAAVRGAGAGHEAALADYRASILAALQDAEASLGRFGAARMALRATQSGLGHAREIARLEGLRGKAGTISRIDVLDAERQAIDAGIAEVNARAQLTLAFVALAKSLGLGWDTDGAVEAR